MPAIRLISVNGSGGAFVDVLATIFSRRVEIIEDEGAQSQQGLDFKVPNDAFATTYDLSSGKEPIILGNIVAHGTGRGHLLGSGAISSSGASISATKLISLRSKTATATQVRVLEIE